MNVLIIDNIVDEAEQRAEYFNFDSSHNVFLAHKRDSAIKYLNKHSFDVIFLDLLLSGKNWMDSILILDEIFNEKKSHGAVFIISQLADSIESDIQLKKTLEKYPILLITTPIDEDIQAPKEYKYIKNIINVIDGTILRHKSKYILSKELIKIIVSLFAWVIGLILLPQLLSYSSIKITSQPIILIVSSVPGMLVASIVFWDKIKYLLSKYFK